MTLSHVSSSGAYLHLRPHHHHDAQMAVQMADLLRRRSCRTAYDLGCGDGSYCLLMRRNGLFAIGIDGNPQAQICSGGYGLTGDLSIPLKLPAMDAVICLEVGEHIPRQYEAVVTDNIASLANKVVVLSWAVPGQRGFHHVNCRPNSHVIGEMAKRGWIHDEGGSAKIRAAAAQQSHFKRNILVFVSNSMGSMPS